MVVSVQLWVSVDTYAFIRILEFNGGQRQTERDHGAASGTVQRRHGASQGTRNVHHKKQSQATAGSSFTGLIRLAQALEHVGSESRSRIGYGQDQTVLFSTHFQAQSIRRGFQCVIKHVTNHLLERRVGHDAQVMAEVVFVGKHANGT